jgi:3-dehydroquinate synthase
MEWYAHCLGWLADHRATRGCTVVALGGGVIGDLAGFVAATYMRGVKLLGIPTTLLAQVDSSVGGKVGLDLPQGKNLVGAFHPAAEVRIAVDVLATLPERQWRNGMAEVWKYGFIGNASLVDTLFRAPSIPPADEWRPLVEVCVAQKAHVVEHDEFETTGLRATLNYGHTIGHAIEKLLGYEELLHGEAIAIGMVLEAVLGERLGVTAPGTSALVRRAMDHAGLPIWHPILNDCNRLVDAMRLDKKASADGLAFSLLTEVGHCKLVRGVGTDEVRAILGDH